MALAYRAGGWSGVTLLFAASGATLFLLLGLEIRRFLTPIGLLLAAALVYKMLPPFFAARPHMLAWPLLAGWTITLLRARARDRAPPLSLAVLMMVWANLHASFVLGFVLLGTFAFEALLQAGDQRPRVLRQWGAFALLSTGAALLTPNGVEGLILPFQILGMKSLPYISEWLPMTFGRVSGFEIALLATLFILLIRGVSVTPVRLVLLLLMLHQALAHFRHQAVLAIVGALVLAGSIGRAAPSNVGVAPGSERTGLTIALVAMALIMISVGRLAIPITRADTANTPVSAIAALPDALRRENGFNNYSFGGPLILNGYRPYVDGRAELYGDDFLLDHRRIVGGDAARWAAAVKRWNIRWAILSPSDGLATLLAADPNWRKIYADNWALVFRAR
jgi:hypothetical protein